jgi:UDPglucose 6-dehydrogenase
VIFGGKMSNCAKIGVLGLWHLGSVTAACMAEAGFSVVGCDPNPEVTSNLAQGKPPLFEPGLEELTKAGLASGRLSFTADLAAFTDCALIWVAFDTPVDADNRADVGYVAKEVEKIFPHLAPQAVVLISSQMPVGSTGKIAASFAEMTGRNDVSFAYLPENLRLGKAIEVFKNPERIVIGVDEPNARAVIETLLAPFPGERVWLSVPSAEMVKHALNSFLATCVTFINEIATICEATGADAAEVEKGLRGDPRVGPKAYVKAGAAFAGGTLGRDVVFLEGLAVDKGLSIPLLSSILPSNSAHRRWPMRQLQSRLGSLKGKKVAVLGLAYKPGTDTLRDSPALDLCQWLLAEGAEVSAHDPAVKALPLPGTKLAASALEALVGADALVLSTEWPDYRSLVPEEVLAAMRHPLVLDQNRFLGDAFAGNSRITYATIGQPL